VPDLTRIEETIPLKTNLPLISFLMAALSLSCISVKAAQTDEVAYVQIQHVGEQTKTIWTVIATADSTIAPLVERDLTVFQIHVLDRDSFSRVNAFLESEGKARGRIPIPVVDPEFEFSNRTLTGAVKSFCFVMPRLDSITFLKAFSRFLSSQQIDKGLLDDVNATIRRVDW